MIGIIGEEGILLSLSIENKEYEFFQNLMEDQCRL